MGHDTFTVPAKEREVKRENRTRHAPMYRVFLHNDDVTPMEFVVQVLRKVFHKDQEEAVEIMLHAHRKNVAHVTTLPLEQAEFRTDQAKSLARAKKFPLTFTFEPEE